MNHLDLIRENFIAKASYFAQVVPGMSVLETAQFSRIDCGLPSDTFNVSVLREAVPEAIPALLEPAVGYFSDKKFPMALWVFESPNYSEIASRLAGHDLPECELNIAMHADLQNFTSNTKDLPDFKIKLATAPEELRSFAEVLAGLFEPLDEARQVRKYYETIAPFYKGIDSQLQFYTGAYNREVVSTGALLFGKDSVGISYYSTQTLVRFCTDKVHLCQTDNTHITKLVGPFAGVSHATIVQIEQSATSIIWTVQVQMSRQNFDITVTTTELWRSKLGFMTLLPGPTSVVRVWAP